MAQHTFTAFTCCGISQIGARCSRCGLDPARVPECEKFRRPKSPPAPLLRQLPELRWLLAGVLIGVAVGAGLALLTFAILARLGLLAVGVQ